jgi:hypothetical protein
LGKEAASMRRIMMLLTVALVMAAMLGVYTQTASAFHAGATADCGSAGTFTIAATQTAKNPFFQAPGPKSVLLFEEGGVLTVFKLTLNGQVLLDKNETGREMNNVNEVTCTFAVPNLGVFEATGVLTP